MKNITKLYAAYKSGFLGDNLLETYFSFIANLIIEKHETVIDDCNIALMFNNCYNIELPLPFVRQLLSVGVNKKCFIEDHGRFSVVTEELSKYRFNDENFNSLWGQLVNKFSNYCISSEIDIETIDINDFILNILNDSDEKILSGEKVENTIEITPIEYAWYRFARDQGEAKTELYSFISALSASNITKQALFYNGYTEVDYSGLNVYLDSPIVFALLGMDEKSRTESYRTLVADMLSAKCSLHVLDHNFQEIDGIIARAAVWSTDNQYDIRKANNATRFFHDSQMTRDEILEFCENLEYKLNELGITVKNTDYDVFMDKFQEDEKCLFDMIKERYSEQGFELPQEKELSIHVDVRSIIMIYRERCGQTATRIQNAKHIMLTSNNTIANVSKKYESNKSIQAGHIPACISADLFGSILWLNSPMRQLEYQKQKLLADCYAFLKPDKKMIDKYIQTLDEARHADEIDEKKYLFLRTHKVVLDSLMDITKGDYARFNSKTYLEVYDDIQSKSLKKYNDEAKEHEHTKDKLKTMEELLKEEKQKRFIETESLKKQIEAYDNKEKNNREKIFEKKVKVFGWIVTLLLIGIPYIAFLIIIEIVKTNFSGFTWRSFYCIGGLIIASIIAGLLFKLGKNKCFEIVRIVLKKRGKK